MDGISIPTTRWRSWSGRLGATSFSSVLNMLRIHAIFARHLGMHVKLVVQWYQLDDAWYSSRFMKSMLAPDRYAKQWKVELFSKTRITKEKGWYMPRHGYFKENSDDPWLSPQVGPRCSQGIGGRKAKGGPFWVAESGGKAAVHCRKIWF